MGGRNDGVRGAMYRAALFCRHGGKNAGGVASDVLTFISSYVQKKCTGRNRRF